VVSTHPARAPFLAPIVLALLLGCPQLHDDRFSSVKGDAGAARPTSVAIDSTAPTVSSVTPADGQRGVLGDAAVEIRFSEAMNPTATEAAYESADLPAERVTFSWRDDDRVLVIRPEQPLRVASGTDITRVSAAQYTYRLQSGASDVAGNRLSPLSVSFFVAREIEQTLGTVRDRTLTGSWRSDGVYGVVDCEIQDNTVCVGDSSSTGEPGYRGFISFDPKLLPSDHLAISAAELSLTMTAEFNTPFDDLGPLHIDKLRFDAIDTAAYEAPAEAALGLLSTAADPGDTMRVDVLGALQADAREGRLNQYRIRFDRASNVDGNADVIVCDWAGAQLRVTYSTP
jgi:Big-like domain-containing protein